MSPGPTKSTLDPREPRSRLPTSPEFVPHAAVPSGAERTLRRPCQRPTPASPSPRTTTPPPSGSPPRSGSRTCSPRCSCAAGSATRPRRAPCWPPPTPTRSTASAACAPPRSGSSAMSAAARGSPCTATTTSTAWPPPRCSCARCERWARTSTGTCPAGSTTATGWPPRRSPGWPSAGPTCWSPSTARSPPSTRSPRRVPRGWTSWSPTITRRGRTAGCPTRRSCTRSSAAIRAPTCARRAWRTSWRARCSRRQARTRRPPTRTSISWPWPRWPTSCR